MRPLVDDVFLPDFTQKTAYAVFPSPREADNHVGSILLPVPAVFPAPLQKTPKMFHDIHLLSKCC